jgi:hypothetical protein
MRNVFSVHNFGEYVRLEKYQKLYGFLVLELKPPSSNPNFLKLSRAHKTSIKNISASLKICKMGHEAPEWPRSDLGSFEIGAPDHSFWHFWINFSGQTFHHIEVFFFLSFITTRQTSTKTRLFGLNFWENFIFYFIFNIWPRFLLATYGIWGKYWFRVGKN